MAYGATVDAWGTTGIYGASRAIARKDLMRIAANLSRFEPVKMLVNNQSDKTEAEQFLAQAGAEVVSQQSNGYESGTVFTGGKSLPAIGAGGSIQLIIQPLDDLWIRDTGPVFVWDTTKSLYGVNFNFNGWGQENTGSPGWTKDPQKAANGVLEQRITEDKLVADFVISQTGARKLSTWLVMEGGGVEVNGKGTTICTESCILNPIVIPEKPKQMLRLNWHGYWAFKR